MQLWHWLLLLGLVFLVTYDPRSGNLEKFFESEISVNASRETQSDSDPSEQSK